jgi:CIC family chloride channel protein
MITPGLARQDGIHLPNLHTREEFCGHTVLQALRRATEILAAQVSVRDALERTRSSEFHSWVVEDEGSIVGIVNGTMLESAVANGRAEQYLMSLFDSLEFPHVHADHPLHLALERMSKAHIDILPVVNRADAHKLEGIATLHDVLGSYGWDSSFQPT